MCWARVRCTKLLLPHTNLCGQRFFFLALLPEAGWAWGGRRAQEAEGGLCSPVTAQGSERPVGPRALCCWTCWPSQAACAAATAVPSSGCGALSGQVPPQHLLCNQVGATCGFCSPPRLLAVELIQKKTGDLSKAIQVPEQTLIFPSPRASQKPKHLTSGEENHFTACAKLYTGQMRGSAMWVSCTDTCFPPSSLDSTQTVCKTLFDCCSRVDDCQLL